MFNRITNFLALVSLLISKLKQKPIFQTQISCICFSTSQQVVRKHKISGQLFAHVQDYNPQIHRNVIDCGQKAVVHLIHVNSNIPVLFRISRDTSMIKMPDFWPVIVIWLLMMCVHERYPINSECGQMFDIFLYSRIWKDRPITSAVYFWWASNRMISWMDQQDSDGQGNNGQNLVGQLDGDE